VRGWYAECIASHRGFAPLRQSPSEKHHDGEPTMVDISSIAQADVLRRLTEADLAEFGAIGREQEFEQRDCLFERGEEAETFYIATRGRFALTLALRVLDRYESMAVEEKGALDAFGWSSLVAPRTSIYSCYCIEAGAAFAFPRQPLEALMAANPRLATEFLRNLNELLGSRVRVLQKLWLDEVSESMWRVRQWTHNELNTQVADVMREPSSAPWRHWFRRRTHLGSRD
jgi:CRP-like cAMP-binding protein